MTAASGPRVARRGRAVLGGRRRAGRAHRARHPRAWADRVHGVLRRRAGVTDGSASVPEVRPPRHRRRACTPGWARAAASPPRGSVPSPTAGSARPSRTRPAAAFLTSAVNGIIGDRLARERPRLAVPLAVRRDGRDVPLRPPTPWPTPSPPPPGGWRSCCTGCRRTSRPSTGTATGRRRRTPTPWPLWAGRRSCCAPTPGSPCARTAWPWPPCSATWSRPGRSRSTGSPWSGTRWAACSMRAACAVAHARRAAVDQPGHRTSSPSGPRTSAPRWPAASARRPRPRPAARDGRVRADPRPALGRRPRPRRRARRRRAAAAARALPPGLGDARPGSPRHPVGRFLGDLLVRQPSAYGRSRRHPGLFPGADELHLPGDRALRPAQPSRRCTRALRRWLAATSPGSARESAVGEQGPRDAWKRRPMRLRSQT